MNRLITFRLRIRPGREHMSLSLKADVYEVSFGEQVASDTVSIFILNS